MNRRAQARPFNVYLLFLMIPDLQMNLFCALTCFLNAIHGRYVSEAFCKFQSFYIIFGVASNTYLNMFVARELHKMLRFSNRRRRYHPPKLKSIISQAMVAYSCAAALAAVGIVNNDSSILPHRTYLLNGVFCVPLEYNRASTIFTYTFFFPIFAGIPLGYLGWVTYDVLRNNLLPPSGREKDLSIYFFRLILVFFVMWVPGFLFVFATSAWIDPWLMWAGGIWSHLQGIASAVVCLLKPDIYQATKDFVTCAIWSNNPHPKDLTSWELRVSRNVSRRHSEIISPSTLKMLAAAQQATEDAIECGNQLELDVDKSEQDVVCSSDIEKEGTTVCSSDIEK